MEPVYGRDSINSSYYLNSILLVFTFNGPVLYGSKTLPTIYEK